MINTLVEKFNDTDSVENSSRVRLESVRKRDEANNTINDLVSKSSNLSILKLAHASKTSATMTSRILKEDLALKPFKESTVHLLKSPTIKKGCFFRMVL